MKMAEFCADERAKCNGKDMTAEPVNNKILRCVRIVAANRLVDNESMCQLGSSLGDVHLLLMEAEPSVSSDTDLPPSSCGNLLQGTVKGWRSVLPNTERRLMILR